jgi:hypothetical protein
LRTGFPVRSLAHQSGRQGSFPPLVGVKPFQGTHSLGTDLRRPSHDWITPADIHLDGILPVQDGVHGSSGQAFLDPEDSLSRRMSGQIASPILGRACEDGRHLHVCLALQLCRVYTHGHYFGEHLAVPLDKAILPWCFRGSDMRVDPQLLHLCLEMTKEFASLVMDNHLWCSKRSHPGLHEGFRDNTTFLGRYTY